MNVPKEIIVHHAASPRSSKASDVDNWHRERWPGFQSKQFTNSHGEGYHVGYHYVIESDGTVVQTRGHDEEGAHTIGMNKSSIGICLVGNFSIERPTPEQERAFEKLARKLLDKFNLRPADIVPHRKYARKECFGLKLSDDHFARMMAQTDSDIKKRISTILELVAVLKNLLTLKRMYENERK